MVTPIDYLIAMCSVSETSIRNACKSDTNLDTSYIAYCVIGKKGKRWYESAFTFPWIVEIGLIRWNTCVENSKMNA